MIHSIVVRIAAYFVLLGFVVFVISPTLSWVRGQGFVINDSYWVELVIFAIIVVWAEVKRFRRVTRTRFK